MPTLSPDGKKVLTPAEARAALDAVGVTVQEFAKKNGLHPSTVYEVLAGRRKGKRGEAHRAACLLGLKPFNITFSPTEASEPEQPADQTGVTPK